jgi:hypothetical protein
VFWYLPCFVLFLAYSSSLMANLTVSVPDRPINTWEDLLAAKYTMIFPMGVIYSKSFEVITSSKFMNPICILSSLKLGAFVHSNPPPYGY